MFGLANVESAVAQPNPGPLAIGDALGVLALAFQAESWHHHQILARGVVLSQLCGLHFAAVGEPERALVDVLLSVAVVCVAAEVCLADVLFGVRVFRVEWDI